MTSLNDVAKAAGVSATTASFVLNGHAESMRIAPQTVERVLRAVRELGYVPNVAAKKLSSSYDRSSGIPDVALMWSPDMHPAFLGSFVTAAQEYFIDHPDDRMHITINPYSISQMHNLDKNFLNRHYNGAVFSPRYEEEFTYIRHFSTRIPLVVLHVPTQLHPNVIVDNYATGRNAAEIFAARGHAAAAMMFRRNIGATDTRDLRSNGFMESCERLGVKPSGIEIPPEISMNVVERAAFGRKIALEMLENGSIPEAIFIQDIVIAIAFSATLMDAGLHIPRDLELIAYGNDDSADAFYPSITTVDYPATQVTRTALQLLAAQMGDPFASPKQITVQPGITFRGSCEKPTGWA